jgi:pyruvate formate lyase activating enzyme
MIKPGARGVCGVRKNIEGKLYSLNYGKVASVSLDPIEKKPLYNFHPGSNILSLGTFGCNFKCPFCQNWSIAHEEPACREITPEQAAQLAVESIGRGNIGLAFTYNEPSVWYEFVYETSVASKKRGLANVLVTNGFISREPLLELLPFIDALNIDVKAFSESFYRDYCRGSLENVKQTVEIAAKSSHIELTCLVIPGLNDSEIEIEKMTEWISSISPDITLHLSRFFPNYRMRDILPTPVETLTRLKEIAQRHLKHIYLGNI